MGNNGRASISNITKHVNARYLFIKGHINQGRVGVKYSFIENMWEYVLNNPKQGKVFREFRGDLINFKVDYEEEVKK